MGSGRASALPDPKYSYLCRVQELIIPRSRLFAVLLPYGDDDIAFFVSRVDVSVRLDHTLQWIAPVDDRFDLSRLDQLSDENQIFHVFLRV